MIKENITIINKLGLHARAASVFVKTAKNFESKIKVSNSKNHADGKNILSLMMLEAAVGNDLTLTIEGPDKLEAMEALVRLIEDRFGESD